MLNRSFKTLNLPNTATTDDMRKAYVKLVRRFPPEHFPEKFRKIKKAYDLLTLNESLVDEFLHKVQGIHTNIELAVLLFADYIDLDFENTDLLSLVNLIEDQSLIYKEICDYLLKDIDSTSINYLTAPMAML
jgi:curved DNA-binding protein CbpA